MRLSGAGGLDDAAVMGRDVGVDQLDADRPKPFERALFVGSDQARVARHIRSEDGSKTTGRGHFCRIAKELPIEIST